METTWTNKLGRWKNQVWARKADLPGFAAEKLDDVTRFRWNGNGASLIFGEWPEIKFIGTCQGGQRVWMAHPLVELHFDESSDACGKVISPTPGFRGNVPTAEVVHEFLEEAVRVSIEDAEKRVNGTTGNSAGGATSKENAVKNFQNRPNDIYATGSKILKELRQRFHVDASDMENSGGTGVKFTLAGGTEVRLSHERGMLTVTIGNQRSRFPERFGAVLLAEIANEVPKDLPEFVARRSKFYRDAGFEVFTGEDLPAEPEPVEEEKELTPVEPLNTGRTVRRMDQEAPEDIRKRLHARSLKMAEELGSSMMKWLAPTLRQLAEKEIPVNAEEVDRCTVILKVPCPKGDVEFLLELHVLCRAGKEPYEMLNLVLGEEMGSLPVWAFTPLCWEAYHGYHLEHADMKAFIDDILSHYTKTKDNPWNMVWRPLAPPPPPRRMPV